MTIETIAGFNPTDVLSAAITEKLHQLGAKEINVTNDAANDAVTVYGSTAAGRRFGFRLKVAKAAPEAAKSTMEAAPSASANASANVSSGHSAGGGNKGIADVYDVLIEIRDIVANSY